MKYISLVLTILCLACAGCSSRSDAAYRHLLELAGVKDAPEIKRMEFIKTSGMDPYYLAKVEVESRSLAEISGIFVAPAAWKVIDERYITPPGEVEWWRPQDLGSIKIWTPKERVVPTYVEVASGISGSRIVVYVAWMSHLSY